MQEGLPYADIVIIALIAGFILLRLRSVLGQKTGHDNPQFFTKEKAKHEDSKDKIIQLHEKTVKIKPKEEDDPYLEKLDSDALCQTIKEIKNKDVDFNATEFLEGSKMAFEMVFDAFTDDDDDTLKMLLAEDVYEDFSEEIKKREEEENKTETTLVAVLSRDIIQAALLGSKAKITVKFISEQVTVIRNPEGEIVGGDASQTERVENEWMFERDTTSKNPNWKIIET